MKITKKILELKIELLNKLTNSPETSYIKKSNGEYIANINNFHLDYSYGGVALHRIQNKNGGIEDVSQMGHVSKRELFIFLNGYISGIQNKGVNV